MRFAYLRDAFNRNKVDNTIPHLTGEMLRAHRFAFPPIAEQKAIVAYLDETIGQVEKVVARSKTEIELQREYRTRLIADAVTGEIDVREAAAHLRDAPTTLEDEGFLAEDASESDAAELDDAEAEVPA